VHPQVTSASTSYLVAFLMAGASICAIVARPDIKVSAERPPIILESAIPRAFAGWRPEPHAYTKVVNPEAKELLEKLYSQVVSRIYVNDLGYRIMLSVAYGGDQLGSLRAHEPEVCYPAQGFTVHTNEEGVLPTSFGDIAVRRLYTTLGSRKEPVTYWFTVGDRAVLGRTQKRWIDLRLGLTGRIPDGLIFRVSSLDSDPVNAYRMQAKFVNELILEVSPEVRRRLAGLDEK
jgi:EpsI family protein